MEANKVSFAYVLVYIPPSDSDVKGLMLRYYYMKKNERNLKQRRLVK
jgi:hypothetical protein